MCFRYSKYGLNKYKNINKNKTKQMYSFHSFLVKIVYYKRYHEMWFLFVYTAIGLWPVQSVSCSKSTGLRLIWKDLLKFHVWWLVRHPKEPICRQELKKSTFHMCPISSGMARFIYLFIYSVSSGKKRALLSRVFVWIDLWKIWSKKHLQIRVVDSWM